MPGQAPFALHTTHAAGDGISHGLHGLHTRGASDFENKSGDLAGISSVCSVYKRRQDPARHQASGLMSRSSHREELFI